MSDSPQTTVHRHLHAVAVVNLVAGAEHAMRQHALHHCTMRAELIGHFKACMTDIYLHIAARMADYIIMATHP